MDYPTTRKAAKLAGKTHYLTGKPCKHGHVALRLVKGECVECRKLGWAKDNVRRLVYFKTSEVVKEVKRRYYERNRDVVIARAVTRPAEAKRAYRKAWKLSHPDLVRADSKSRRRKHRNATPKWLTPMQRAEMRQIYIIARTMTRLTGVQYVVDHIVPLRGDTVCGLHVPWNLQVMTQTENTEKYNKPPIDTPKST